MKTNTIGFIGGGRITRIFFQAFKNRSVKFESICVFDPNEDVLKKLQSDFPQISIADTTTCARQELVVLAVHPPVMMETLNGIKETISKESIVLSLAPKFNVNKISEVLFSEKVVRMIPNATSFINKGYNPVVFHASFSQEERSEFINFFGELGETFVVEEYKLEGYALVSAMLPTYFWFQWQKMEDIALKTGLSEKEAREAVENTLAYAHELFYDARLSQEQVKDLIPVKPIGDHEEEIKSIFDIKLLGLFEKIKSVDIQEVV